MSKPELGTKRVCPVTGRKFYDLNKDPIVSPYTGQIVPITAAPRGRAEALAAKPLREEEAELPEAADADLVPLEEADAETAGTGVVAGAVDADEEEEDVELAEDLEDDSSFLEETEDEDDDVTDIIGGDIEDEEET